MPTRTFSRDFRLDLVRQRTASLQRLAHLRREHQRAASAVSPLLVLASLGNPSHNSAGVHWLGRTTAAAGMRHYAQPEPRRSARPMVDRHLSRLGNRDHGVWFQVARRWAARCVRPTRSSLAYTPDDDQRVFTILD